MSDPVFRLIYRSHNLIPADNRRKELGALFSIARSNNKQQGISGALLLTGDYFVQALEGDESDVQALFEHICQDERHSDVAVVESGAVPARVFARWSMARVSADEDEPDIRLLARTDGIADASRRGDETPEQDALLRSMRDAAGQASVG